MTGSGASTLPTVYTIEDIKKHLEEWRGHLASARDGSGNNSVSWCQLKLDEWLDELSDARGR
jgi:hypothetical protein